MALPNDYDSATAARPAAEWAELGRHAAIAAVQAGLRAAREALVAHVEFGATFRSVDAALARKVGLPATYGVEVCDVVDGGPAAVAGIYSGDVITDVGGYTLYRGAEQFRAALSVRSPGDGVRIELWRDRGIQMVEVRFPALPPPATGIA